MSESEDADSGLVETRPRPFVFVLMPFDAEFNDIYKFGIKGAASEVDAYADRLDEQIFDEGMLERIYNQIAKADVVVADMTNRKPNVFYEVGYAHALGKIVLLLTQRAEDIPFDLKHRQHTVYGQSIETLRTELVPRLRWALSESARRGRSPRRDDLTVRVCDVLLAEGMHRAPARVVLEPNKPNPGLSFTIRNNSPTAIEVTNCYFFVRPESSVRPVKCDQFYIPSSFPADPADATDGLSRQIPLPIPSLMLPPSATGRFVVLAMASAGGTFTGETCRIRFHSLKDCYDYRFELAADEGAPLQESPKP